MYNLFTKRFTANNSIIRPPGFELLRRTYEVEVSNIVNYFNNRVYAVASNHILVRLLNTASVPFSYDLDRYAEAALARSPYVAKTFNFTSDINYGKFFDGVFYGEGNTELILYDEDYFEPFSELSNWKSIQAIKVLDHNVSSLGLLLPNGKVNNTDKGLAVIAINIPLLLIQYRGFVTEQQAKINNGDSNILGATHFVHMYVLPNMLYSHIEIVLLNRLANIFYGAPMGENLKKYPFPLIDYSYKVDKVLTEILKRIKDNRLPYYTTLKMIPSIFKEDCQESLLMPDIARTRQIWWLLLLTRFKAMKFLIEAGGEKGIVANRTYIAKLKIDLKRLLNENIIATVLPEDIYFDIVSDIENMLNI
jgi:hypothetical protein